MHFFDDVPGKYKQPRILQKKGYMDQHLPFKKGTYKENEYRNAKDTHTRSHTNIHVFTHTCIHIHNIYLTIYINIRVTIKDISYFL